MDEAKHKIEEELMDLEQEVSDAEFAVDADNHSFVCAKKNLDRSKVLWAEAILKLEQFKKDNNILNV